MRTFKELLDQFVSESVLFSYNGCDLASASVIDQDCGRRYADDRESIFIMSSSLALILYSEISV